MKIAVTGGTGFVRSHFARRRALVCEATTKVPLVASAKVRILSEGVVEPATECDPLPPDLSPERRFTPEQIRDGLPEAGPFRLSDLRCCV